MSRVFPREKDGDRSSPMACMGCVFKTECLKEAMETQKGLRFREERLGRAQESGMMGFFERWSQKKSLHNKMKGKRATKTT